MINHWLVDTITKMNYTQNEYGDFTYTSQTDYNCRFREINRIELNNYREDLDSDAMVWFETSADINLNDILKYGNDYYRVTNITKARKGFETAVDFVKVFVVKHRQVS